MAQGPFDPLSLWRDMLSKWEMAVNETANKNMASPEFSQFMNQAMGMSMQVQHAPGEAMGKYLTAMNLPSRADLLAIGERLQGIEAQLTRLSAQVERGAGEPSSEVKQTYAGPPRTKRPPQPLNGPPSIQTSVAADTAVQTAAAAKPARRAPKKKSRAP